MSRSSAVTTSLLAAGALGAGAFAVYRTATKQAPRAVVDGRHKMVRWFSPLEYGAPTSVDELYETSDVSLHDLIEDPQEMENLGNPEHPRHDRELVESLLGKLNTLIERELGEDPCPFDLDMFGTRDVTYDG